MRPGNTPHQISNVKSFHPSTIISLEDQPAGSFCGFSNDGKVGWIVRGSLLEVIKISSCERLAAWKFGQIIGDVHTNITCVKEFRFGQSRKLLVGVCNASSTGLLCLFDVSLSKVVKAIEIPQPVTEVGLVSTSTGNQVPRWALSEQLAYFCGLVAVGTQTGKVYLVDLCTDDNEFYSDEEVPSKLHFISPRIRDIENQRFHCMSQGLHLSMVLNDSMYDDDVFEYQKPDGMVMKTYSLDNVSVTSLKYIKQAGLLVIGYSFGCYQLWKLSVPVLEYSSRLESEPSPVTHITYQEPENDPKNFCYIWVARGEKENEEQVLDTVSTVAMYQLAFSSKTYYSGYGVYYEDLMSVCLRLDHELTTNFIQSGSNYDGASKVLGCYTLEDPYYQPPCKLQSQENDSFEEGILGPDLSLCVFVWEATEGSLSSNTHQYLAIFDINRWYHAQMPSTVRYVSGSTDLCAYLCSFMLDEATEKTGNDNLLMANVRSDRLLKFINHSPVPPEQHFYPSSLAFVVDAIFDTSMIEVQFLGSQRQILATIESQGPNILIQPTDIYNLCIHVGLLPKPTDITLGTSNMNLKRESVLSLALEYNMVSFLKSCIVEWSTGEFEHHGCTLKFLLDWAWDTVSSTKQKIDITCVPLFNWSGQTLDKRSVQTLITCNQKLTHLTTLFRTFLSQSGPITDKGREELESKILVTSLLSQHLSVILWFVDAGLLPEDDDTEVSTGGLYCYPATSLMTAYKNRRTELNRIHSDVKDTDLLMIDGLVEAVGVQEIWERDGGTGLYPPPSIHSLLSTYLLENCDMLYKHCLVLYLLLDLVSVDCEENGSFSEKVNGFARIFNLPQNMVKLVQAFWLLDHKDFEDGLNLLLDPMVRSDFGRWQHKRIIKSLLYQDDAKMALLYLSTVNPALTTPEEVKLKLTVLLANGLTAEALEYQRECCDKNNIQDLLTHLFLGCQQTKTVGRLLQLPLTNEEEKFLVDYLLDSSEPHSQELLVMHYLQRARFVEAIQLNEKLKHSILSENNAAARERAAARNAIVEGYANTLPAVQRRLMFEQVHVPKKNVQWRREVRRPTPLSTQITKSNAKVLSQSVFIMTIMEKLDEIESPELDRNVVQDQSVGPFVCTPVTPSRKSLRDTPVTSYPNHEGNVSVNDRMSLNKTIGMFSSTDTPSKSANRTKFFSASCLSLLKTPTIKQMTPKRQTSTTNVITPQSILKVRHMISTTSPSPHSGNVTPNSQEIEGSSRKSGRKLGYGSTSTTPLSSIPRRLAGDVSMSTSVHSPKSVSFVEPTSPSSPPVKHSPIYGALSQSSGSKSVSFSEKSFMSASSLQPLSTPKQLKFSEPKQRQGSAMARKSPRRLTPPGSPKDKSPRSVRDRSPTPESIERSPKLVRNLDQLHRPPLHTTPVKLTDVLGTPTKQEPTPTKESEDLVLHLDNSDDNISDEEVEEMMESFASSKQSPASADMSVSSTTTVREHILQTSVLITPQKRSPVKETSSPSVRISKSSFSEFTSQNRKLSTEHAQSELPVQTGSVTSDEKTGAQAVETENVEMEMDKSGNQEIFDTDEELNPPGEIEEMETVSSSEEIQTQSIKQEVDEFMEPPEPVRLLEPPQLSPEVTTDDGQLSAKVKDSPTDNYETEGKDSEYVHDILQQINDKFGESPSDADVKSEEEDSTNVSNKSKRSLKKFHVSVIKPESEEESDAATASEVPAELPVTPTRMTRRKKSVSDNEEPVTPTRSTRGRRKNDGEQEVMTPTRSSRRLNKKDTNVQENEVNKTPTRSRRKTSTVDETTESEVIQIDAKSNKPFTSEAKKAVQESLAQLSEELHEKMNSPERTMTKIKDKSPKTPTRIRKSQKEAVTPTRVSSRLANKTIDTEGDENLPVTPTRSKGRGKKVGSPAGVQEKPVTPRRGTRKTAETKEPDVAENKNDNRTNSPEPDSDDKLNIAQTKQTPTRSRRKKNDSVVMETKSEETEDQSDSKRDSFGFSEIPDDIDMSESVNATPTRRRSLSRACKTVNENTVSTPTRRQSLGISNKLSVEGSKTPPRRQSLGRGFKVREDSVEKKLSVTSSVTELPVIEQSPVKEEEKVPTTPSRRGRPKKVADDTTNTDDDKSSAPLTPSRRGRQKKVKPQIEEADSSTKDEPEIDNKTEISRSKKAKMEDDVNPAAHTRSHDVTRKNPNTSDVFDVQTNSFQFSDPMQIDTSEPAAKAFTPVKSFIFSPPIAHTRSRIESQQSTESEGILLPPGPAVPQVTDDDKPTEKKKPKRRMKRLYKEEEILLISPVSQADGDSGSEGLSIITGGTRKGTKSTAGKKGSSKVVIPSVAGHGRKLRSSSRFGPVGSKKTS
ncbi:Protein ELYS [Mactra antiquata]